MKTRFITFSTTSNLQNDIINETKDYGIGGKKDKIKRLSIFSTFLKKSTEANHVKPGVKNALKLLWNMFIYILVLQYFYSKYYIHIKINISKYAICKVFSQLTLDQLS